MSKFHIVYLVHFVLLSRGALCSPSPKTKWDGRRVEIWRSWSENTRLPTLKVSKLEQGRSTEVSDFCS